MLYIFITAGSEASEANEQNLRKKIQADILIVTLKYAA